MTNQEAFNKVCEHLLTQNEKSHVLYNDTRGDRCLYRGPNGLKCAVGVLIPDEEYDHEFDDAADTSIEEVRKFVPALAGLDLVLLTELQTIHDQEAPRDWAYMLDALADKFSLDVPQIVLDRLS